MSKADNGLFKLQQQIKQNTHGIQEYISDLNSWTNEIQTKEKTVQQKATSQPNQQQKNLPPIRNKVDIQQQMLQQARHQQQNTKAKSGNATTNKEQTYQRDVTPMPDYYKAWDKFDVDKAIQSDEEEEKVVKAPYQERPLPQTQEEMMKLTSGAKPNTKIVIKGGTVKQNAQAEHLKSQGNSYFASLDYDNAINCYSRCLEKIPENDNEMKKIVLSNRAQSYLKLKKYKEAEADANEALLIDPLHLKSISRRGTARYYLGQLKQSQRDFQRSLELEPANKQTIEYLRKVGDKLSKIKIEAYEKLKRKSMFIEVDENELLKVQVEEINWEGTEKNIEQKKLIEKKEEVVVRQKKENKKKKKRKGIADFMEDENEAKAFKEESKADQEQPTEPTTKKKKKSVGFNLENNQVQEFDKTKRITENIQDGEKDNGSSSSKKTLQQENIEDEIKRTKKPKATKKPVNLQEIEKLNKSEVVNQARKNLLEVPQSGSQFERDYKSLKNDLQCRLEYLLRIDPSTVKKIFKVNLETDVLIDMIKVFNQQDEAFFSTNTSNLLDFFTQIASCEPFEMAVEFLSEAEKKDIRTFFEKVAQGQSTNDLKKKFKI